MRGARSPLWFLTVLGWAGSALAKNPPFLEQGFMFNIGSTTAPPQPPVVEQCGTLSLTWGRDSVKQTAPSPSPPYFLEVFTSAFIVPFVVAAGSGSDLSFDWQVPFNPGTQFQICMWDSTGVTGGCQEMYTVIPSSNSSGTPSCTNVTFPAGAMGVDAEQSTGGILSQFGWPDQCSDISVTPKNGTPPYTFTMAPTLHPPVNITSNSMTTMSLQVNLNWASPFFVAVVDAVGNSWSYGPLHAGGNGQTSCLDLDGSSTVSVPVVIGTAIGALVLGSVLAFIASFLYGRRRRAVEYDRVLLSRKISNGSMDSHGGHERPLSGSSGFSRRKETTSIGLHEQYASTGSRGSGTSNHSFLGRLGAHGAEYQVEPFVMPEGRKTDPFEPVFRHPQDGSSSSQTEYRPTSRGSEPRPGFASQPSDGTAASGSGSAYTEGEALSPHTQQSHGSPQGAGQVYVVHHDGGRAPVTVFTPEGTEVVELPPQYRDDRRHPNQQRRQPAAARKPESPVRLGSPGT